MECRVLLIHLHFVKTIREQTFFSSNTLSGEIYCRIFPFFFSLGEGTPCSAQGIVLVCRSSPW